MDHEEVQKGSKKRGGGLRVTQRRNLEGDGDGDGDRGERGRNEWKWETSYYVMGQTHPIQYPLKAFMQDLAAPSPERSRQASYNSIADDMHDAQYSHPPRIASFPLEHAIESHPPPHPQVMFMGPITFVMLF